MENNGNVLIQSFKPINPFPNYENSNLRIILCYSKNYSINYDKNSDKWIAQIRRNNKLIFHKYFDSEEEAVFTRNKFIIDNNLEYDYELN
jgi:hypothetical protein